MLISPLCALGGLVNCWPTPSNDGTCDVNIEYELENEGVALYDVVISIPLPCVPIQSIRLCPHA